MILVHVTPVSAAYIGNVEGRDRAGLQRSEDVYTQVWSGIDQYSSAVLLAYSLAPFLHLARCISLSFLFFFTVQILGASS